MSKKKLASLFAIVACLVIFSSSVFAGNLVTSQTHEFYNGFGIKSATVTFYSEGNNTTHKVYDKYLTSWTIVPYGVKDTSTWITTYPSCVKAKGQYTVYAGLDTQWVSLPVYSYTGVMTHTY